MKKCEYRKISFVFLAVVMLSAWFVLNNLIIKSSCAMEPPRAGEIESLRKTGELQKRLEFAKEIGNHKVDSYLLKKAINKTKRMMLQSQGKKLKKINSYLPSLAPPPNRQGMPTMGNVRTFTLLIEFKDFTHANTNTRDFIHNRLYGAGDPANSPYESLATYYLRSSYNQLDLRSGNTFAWYKTSYDRSDVKETAAGRESLIKEALDFFNSQGHDFSQYDNNSDGVIDYFLVFWAGPDTGWGNFWWGWQLVFSDTNYKLDGTRLGKYSFQWAEDPVGSNFNNRVSIHETGHALGQADFYDYNDKIGPDGGIGGLDMMHGNKGDHGCFTKWMFGWITPKTIANGRHTLTLNASGTSEDAVIVWPNITTGDLFSEFFMVQNRHRVGNDNTPEIPGDGILIWHIDAHLNSTGRDFLYDNSYSDHKMVRLMEADGREEIEGCKKGGCSSVGDAGDYYDSGDSFGPSTTPSSATYDVHRSLVNVYGFSTPGIQMQSTFNITDLSTHILTYNGQYVVAEEAGGGAVNANRNQAREWEMFTFVDINGGNLMSGDAVYFKAYDNIHYLVAVDGGGNEVKANSTSSGKFETFIIRKIIGSGRIYYGDKISLQAHNGHYVVAEDGGGGAVKANRTQVKEWETFRLYSLLLANYTSVSIQTYNGQYVVAEEAGGGAVNANRNQAGEWETFTLIDINGDNLMSGDAVYFKAYDNLHYLVAEGGGGKEVKADRTSAREWEKFIIKKLSGTGQIVSGDKISLQAQNGNYVVAEGGGGGVINANRAQVKEWETFKINILR